MTNKEKVKKKSKSKLDKYQALTLKQAEAKGMVWPYHHLKHGGQLAS